MTVLTVEGKKYYSANVVVEKRGDLFANGKPRSIFLNKKVEVNKEKDCLFFYLKEDKWVVTTPKYPKATVFFSGEWMKKMKIKADEHTEVEIKEEVAKDIKPKRKHERIKPVHNLTFEQLMKGNAQETIKEVELTKEQRGKMVGLAYEKLTDKYYRVKYLNLDLIMDTEGYCNATNMCILGGKEFAHWKRTKSAKEYLNALQKEPCRFAGLLHPVLYQVNLHDCNEVIRGTYVHPDLIVIIGMWISKEFGFKVQSIVKENILRESAYEMRRLNKLVDEEKSLREIAEEERQKAEEREEKAEAARQKAEEEYAKAEAARQEEKLARQRAEEEYAKAEIERQKAEEARIFAMEKLSKIGKTLNKQCKMTDKVLDVVEETASRFVPPTKNKGDTEYCVCFELIEGVKYSINRIQERAILKTEKALREQYPNAKMFYKMETVNSVNVFVRLKDYFENVEEVDITYTKITVTDEYIGREDIVDALKNIHDKKYNACNKLKFIKRKTQKHSDYYNVD